MMTQAGAVPGLGLGYDVLGRWP